MGRLIRTVAAAFLAVAGLAAAAAVPAWASRPAGLGPKVRVFNLHSAYEAHLGHTKPGKISGIVYARGKHPRASRAANANTTCSEPNCPLVYGGGPVQHSPHVWLLLWGPAWSSNTGEEASAAYLDSFYSGLGIQPDDSWSTTTDQYTDSSGHPSFSGSVYEGVSQDISTPPSGVDQSQLAAEADAFASSEGITDLADAQIVIATQSGTCPQGFAGCGGTYCAWHSISNEPYTNLPYLLDAGQSCGEGFINSPGTHDGFSIVGGHEYAETITDPVPPTGWVDNSDNVSGGEIGDKCAWGGLEWGSNDPFGNVTLSTGTFAMQSLWSNTAYNATGKGCVMSTVQTLSSSSSSTTLSASASPAIVNQQVTYTAVVSPVPDGGTVAFTDRDSSISHCGAVPISTTTGQAICQVIYNTTTGSPHLMKASYSGDPNYYGSESSIVPELVVVPTSTALSSTPNSAAVGQPVAYTATVTPMPDGGTVAFTDGGGTISGCGSVAVNTTTGQASCETTYMTTAGSPHSITANYLGNTHYTRSSSSTVSETIGPAGTSTALSSSADPVGVGQQVTYTAAVSPAPDGGTVAFTDGGSAISGCGSQPVSISTGKASCQVTYTTTAGSPHSIKAGYSGNADYKSSQSSAVAQSVRVQSVTVSGAPRSTGSGVRDKLTCNGLPGQSCQVTETLMTTETLVGGKPIAVTASAAKKKHKTIPVGAKSVTIAAGQSMTVTIELNAVGRRLLKQFGKLPVIVSIKLQLNGRKVTVATRKVTIKPRKHRGTSLDVFVPGPLVVLRF